MNKASVMGLLIILLLNLTLTYAQTTSDIVITLERTYCFGTCPVYTVNIHADGYVQYSGEDFVEVSGEQSGQIAPETVTQMIAAFEDAGYFEWEDTYDTQSVTDLPTIITSVTRNGETKRISRYAGDSSAPSALPFLELWVDIMANTSLWTGVQPDMSSVLWGPNTPLITLQRDPCFGFCPVYNVAAYEDGTVVYMGIANVETIGIKVLKADPLSVDGIAQQAQAFGYFDWQDRYDRQVMTDQATVITSIRAEDNLKRILRYDGDPNAPIGLLRIEESIDLLVTE